MKSMFVLVTWFSMWPLIACFDVIWNVPTQQCRRNDKIDFPTLLRAYGILVNDDDTFQGDTITIYYERQLGLYPSLTSNGTEINGGIPQLGDFKGHLKKAGQDLKNIPPTQSANGSLRVIDWEAWRPTWEFNWGSLGVYQARSKEFAQQTNLKLLAKQIDKLAEAQWENTTKEWMLQTLLLAKKLQPKNVWGYYLFPDCYNYKGNSSEDFQCSAKTKKGNDKLKWLWDASTALFPSLYIYARQFTEYSAEQRTWFTNGRLQETLRVANANAKIYPYVNFNIKPGVLHPKREFWRVMAQVAALGMDGVVVWGSSSSVSSERLCLQLRDYVTDILGPVSESTKWNAAKCSKAICHDRGACTWKNDPLVVAWKILARESDAKFHAADVSCRCQPAFTGRFCESEVSFVPNE